MRFRTIGEGVMSAYVDRLRAEGRACEQSIIWVSVFDNWCQERYPGATSVTQEMVDGWCAPRPTERRNSTRTRVYPVVAVLSYMRERGLTVAHDPEIPKCERSAYVPHAFTRDELDRFFATCDRYGERCCKRRAGRNLALTVPVFFRLLYSSGMRTTEARLLAAGDVDLETGVVRIVRSKGSDRHIIALHPTMLAAMRRYDDAIGRLYHGREFFFPVAERGGRSTYWVWKTFREVWDSVNDSHATPYQLRHNYAVENINSWGGDCLASWDRLVYLSRSMGHAHLESTRRYYSIVPALADVIDSIAASACDDDVIPGVAR